LRHPLPEFDNPIERQLTTKVKPAPGPYSRGTVGLRIQRSKVRILSGTQRFFLSYGVAALIDSHEDRCYFLESLPEGGITCESH